MSSIEYLYHYYEGSKGPFLNLSDQPLAEAEQILMDIKQKGVGMAALRRPGYLNRRNELEHLARSVFISKGGKPIRNTPHYMIVGPCDWLRTWYAKGTYVRIHLSQFSIDTLSFTYGDLFPTFSPRVTDNREYRRQVYTYQEILGIIDKYGLPQHWNRDGTYGPERYVEVQLWAEPPELKDRFRERGE